MMKQKTKSIIVVLLAIAMMFSVIFVSQAKNNGVVGEESTGEEDTSEKPTEKPDDREFKNTSNVTYVFADTDIADFLVKRGDINGDGKVQASDARLALRASAKLENLSDEQLKSADVIANGEVTAADARSILRVSAKIDEFPRATLVLRDGMEYKFGPLKYSGAYHWLCMCGDEYVRSENKSEIPATDESGEPIVGMKGTVTYFITATLESGANESIKEYKLTHYVSEYLIYDFSVLVY